MPSSLYFGTIGMSTWHSSDLGDTLVRFMAVHGLYSESRVWGLAGDPARPNVVLAGTDSGVYRLDRAGLMWTHLPSPMDGACVWSIAFTPSAPGLVLAGISPSAIFRSEDGGESWERSLTEFPQTCRAVQRPRITQIIIDPRDARRAWCSIEIGGVWRSEDGGRSWTPCAVGLVSDDVHNMALAYRGDQVVLYATTNKGLHVSEDGGERWTHRPLDTPWTYMRGIAAGVPGTLFLGNGDGVPGSTGRLMRSRDYGETWQDAGLPGELKSTPWCIAINPADPQVMFVSTCFGKYFRSTDGGESWTRLARELGETRALLCLPA